MKKMLRWLQLGAIGFGISAAALMLLMVLGLMAAMYMEALDHMYGTHMLPTVRAIIGGNQ